MFTEEELEVIEQALFDYQHTCDTNAELRVVHTVLDKIDKELNP